MFLTTVPPIKPDMSFFGDTYLQTFINVSAGILIFAAVLASIWGALSLFGGRAAGNVTVFQHGKLALEGGVAAIVCLGILVALINWLLSVFGI